LDIYSDQMVNLTDSLLSDLSKLFATKGRSYIYIANGRDPAGLAPVDLTLDTSLRPGDVIAATSGLVAYSGVKVGVNQTAEFTPVASYPGLTAEVRARLGEMKVAPVSAETVAVEAPLPDVALPATSVPKTVSTRAKRAELD
ncbi:MAG: hypothetical protein JWP51_1595, partial [Bradyrhizobium sp.]|nr:hypothetical protein [Bradyrhizobium sp.]